MGWYDDTYWYDFADYNKVSRKHKQAAQRGRRMYEMDRQLNAYKTEVITFNIDEDVLHISSQWKRFTNPRTCGILPFLATTKGDFYSIREVHPAVLQSTECTF